VGKGKGGRGCEGTGGERREERGKDGKVRGKGEGLYSSKNSLKYALLLHNSPTLQVSTSVPLNRKLITLKAFVYSSIVRPC